jgi:DNA/RNA endonuclease YhcR with UshA esterase domain
VEYKDAANLSASGVTNTALAAAQEISALSEDLMNAYVLVKNVKSFTTSGNNITANFEDGTTMVMYNQFSVEVPTTEGNYTVEGAVGKFNTNLQLYIINIEGYVPEEHNVNSIAEAYELPENATFTMFDEMVVTYQRGNRLWIRDNEGTSGMIYGDLGLENALENGQVLTDGWSATYAIYNGTPEFTNPDGVEPDGTNTREAAPYLRNSITTSNVNEYIIMKGLSLLPDAGNAKKFYNATDSLVIFNSFNVTIPEVEEGKTYDVTGIVTIYFGEAQVYITEMTEVTALRGDVDLDGEVNIADVTALIDMLLTNAGTSSAGADCNLDGSVDISDVTALIDYLLSNKWAE